MRHIRQARWLVALALVMLAVVGTQPASAQTAGRSVAWQRFDIDLVLQNDGSVAVTETQSIQFTGTYQQGYRIVPLDRTTGVSNVTVAEVINGSSTPYTRGNGQPGTYSTSTTTNGLEIDWWFPPTTNATRTFIVHYVAAGATRIYNGGDQLQWRAVYADRAGPIGASTVTVHLPADVDPSGLRTAWYQYTSAGTIGALQPSGDGTQLDPRTVQFTLGPLPANVGAEIRVQIPHGIIQASPPAWQAGADRADQLAQTVAPIAAFLSLLLFLLILAGGGAILLLLWYTGGREPAVGSVPRTLQEPPSELTAPLAGTLTDQVASEREAVAALVELADRGFLQMKDEPNPQLAGSRTDLRLRLEIPLNDPRLRSYERVLLAALFGLQPEVPTEVLLSTAMPQFRTSIPIIQSRLYETLQQENLFKRDPATARRRCQTVGITLLLGGCVLAVAGAMVLGALVGIAWLPGVGLALIGGGALFLSGHLSSRTQQGALEAARWRAFGRHLHEVLRSGTPDTALAPHYLAYAVAFGQDEAYVKHLESVGTPPPGWYQPRPGYGGPGGIVVVPGPWYGRPGGPGPMPSSPGPSGGVAMPSGASPQGWSDLLAALLNAASEAMSHGGGSGGWSGGGFGGGGGGGGGSGGFN